MKRGLCRNAFSVLLLALCAAGLPPWASAQAGRRPRLTPVPQTQPEIPQSMTMRVEDEVVSAEIRATPLQRVLEEVAARTGIIFEVSSELNPPVNVSLYRVGLQEAVQRVIGGNDSILYYHRDAAGQSRINFARVFPRGLKGRPSGIVYIGTGVPTKSGTDTPEQALKALAESESVEAKERAIEVLIDAGGDVAVQALTQALGDGSTEVQVAAIEGLARLGARQALPRIVSALKHGHPGVRQSAVEALALLGGSQNVKDLRPLLLDKDGAVAAAAEMAVRKLSAESHPVP